MCTIAFKQPYVNDRTEQNRTNSSFINLQSLIGTFLFSEFNNSISLNILIML